MRNRMGTGFRTYAFHFLQRRPLSSSKPPILPSHPRGEGLIEMAKDLNTLGPIESSVVVHPATHHRVDDSGQVLQPLVVPGGGHLPFGDGLPNRLGGLGTHRRKKAHEEFSPAILCPSRLEEIGRAHV